MGVSYFEVRKSRKERKCCKCGKVIKKGEYYIVESYINYDVFGGIGDSGINYYCLSCAKEIGFVTGRKLLDYIIENKAKKIIEYISTYSQKIVVKKFLKEHQIKELIRQLGKT